MAQLRIIEMMVHGSKEILTSSVFFFILRTMALFRVINLMALYHGNMI